MRSIPLGLVLARLLAVHRASASAVTPGLAALRLVEQGVDLIDTDRPVLAALRELPEAVRF